MPQITTMNASRYQLEDIVRSLGYNRKEIESFTIAELRSCIWNARSNYDGDI